MNRYFRNASHLARDSMNNATISPVLMVINKFYSRLRLSHFGQKILIDSTAFRQYKRQPDEGYSHAGAELGAAGCSQLSRETVRDRLSN